jgi:hypothetical protein
MSTKPLSNCKPVAGKSLNLAPRSAEIAKWAPAEWPPTQTHLRENEWSSLLLVDPHYKQDGLQFAHTKFIAYCSLTGSHWRRPGPR